MKLLNLTELTALNASLSSKTPVGEVPEIAGGCGAKPDQTDAKYHVMGKFLSGVWYSDLSTWQKCAQANEASYANTLHNIAASDRILALNKRIGELEAQLAACVQAQPVSQVPVPMHFGAAQKPCAQKLKDALAKAAELQQYLNDCIASGSTDSGTTDVTTDSATPATDSRVGF